MLSLSKYFWHFYLRIDGLQKGCCVIKKISAHDVITLKYSVIYWTGEGMPAAEIDNSAHMHSVQINWAATNDGLIRD